MKPTLRLFPFLGILLSVTLACRLTQTAVPTATPAPELPASSPTSPAPVAAAPTAAASIAPGQAPAEPTYQIAREPVSEQSQDPRYEIDLVLPRMVGPSGAVVDNFNTWMARTVSEMMASFKTDVAAAYAQATPDPSLGSVTSGLSSEYELLYQSGEIVSLLLKNSAYMAGAAHPLPFAQAVNYSIPQARILALEDLFRPGAPYLEALSAACVRELQNHEYVTGLEGAAPRAENFRNWNITSDGLLITFDPYQVAAYAAGYVSVTVPYADLQELIEPSGPLASLP